MTARLKFLCHPATASVRAAAFPSDEPLDIDARRKLTGVPRRQLAADHVLTSPALRASQSAETLKLAASIEPMLRDCDYGRWTGLSFDDVERREPDAIAKWLSDPGAAPHGGESMLALMARVARWLDAQAATQAAILAITHASVIRAAVVHAIKAGPDSFWRIDVAPLSLTRLSGHQGRWNLVSIGPMRAEASEP